MANALITAPQPEAVEAGADVLRSGGNAVDAAIAIQFALAVVYPRAGNLAGGGFMVLRNADGSVASLDYRERAPGAASAGAYPSQVLDTLMYFLPQTAKKEVS